MSSNSDPEKYLLRTKTQIIQTLRLFMTNKCMVTARFGAGKYSFVTVVIEVFPDKNVVVLDYGRDETVNRKLLDAQQATFFVSYQGIEGRFSSDLIAKKEFQGGDVFVIPIPNGLYWYEKREFYRVKLPLNIDASCEIPFETDGNVETRAYRIANLSITGVGLIEKQKNSRLSEKIGARFEKCRLFLPDHREDIQLEIRHCTPVWKDDKIDHYNLGCRFIELNQRIQSKILRLMQSIEMQRIKSQR